MSKPVDQLTNSELVKLLEQQNVHPNIVTAISSLLITGLDFTDGSFLEVFDDQSILAKYSILPVSLRSLKRVHAQLTNKNLDAAVFSAVAATAVAVDESSNKNKNDNHNNMKHNNNQENADEDEEEEPDASDPNQHNNSENRKNHQDQHQNQNSTSSSGATSHSVSMTAENQSRAPGWKPPEKGYHRSKEIKKLPSFTPAPEEDSEEDEDGIVTEDSAAKKRKQQQLRRRQQEEREEQEETERRQQQQQQLLQQQQLKRQQKKQQHQKQQHKLGSPDSSSSSSSFDSDEDDSSSSDDDSSDSSSSSGSSSPLIKTSRRPIVNDNNNKNKTNNKSSTTNNNHNNMLKNIKSAAAAAAPNSNLPTMSKSRQLIPLSNSSSSSSSSAQQAKTQQQQHQQHAPLTLKQQEKELARYYEPDGVAAPPLLTNDKPVLLGGENNLKLARLLKKNNYENIFASLKQLPRGHHRNFDLLLFAKDKFLMLLHSAVLAQKASRSNQNQNQNNNNTNEDGSFRFIWSTDSEMHEAFFMMLDRSKILWLQLKREIFGTNNNNNNDISSFPDLQTFQFQLISQMMSESKVEQSVVSQRTFQRRIVLWNESISGNNNNSNTSKNLVEDRARKLEQYILKRTGVVTAIKGAGAAVVSTSTSSSSSSTAAASSTNLNQHQNQASSSSSSSSSSSAVSSRQFKAMPGQKSIPSSKQQNQQQQIPLPASKDGVEQQQQEHAYPTDIPLRSKVKELIGSFNEFPAYNRDRLTEWIAICEHAQDPKFRNDLLGYISRAVRGVHQSFERLHGVSLVKRWIDELLFAKVKIPGGEEIACAMIEKLSVMQCVCSDATRNVWLSFDDDDEDEKEKQQQQQQQQQQNKRKSLNWLRKALVKELGAANHEVQSWISVLVDGLETMLRKTAPSGISTIGSSSSNPSSSSNSSYSYSSSLTSAIPNLSGQRRSNSSSSNNNNNSQSPYNSAAAAAARAKQHEDYRERQLKNALELRKNALTKNSSSGNNNNASSNSASSSTNNAAAATYATSGAGASKNFDEVRREQPRYKLGQDGGGELFVVRPCFANHRNKSCVVAENVNPLKLLSME